MASKDSSVSRSLLDEIRERGFIRVIAHWGVTSMQYLDPDTDEPAGFVGLAGKLLARDLGVRAEFVTGLPSYDDYFPALREGRADVRLKVTNTPQRGFEVEFTTQSIICEEGRFVIRRDRGLHSEADLNQSGRIIAVAKGSSQALHGREYPPPAQIRTFPTATDIFEAVLSGEVDACMHDTRVPTFLLAHPECTVLTGGDGQPVVPYVDCIHPCIKVGDQRFLNWLNNWVAFWKAGGTFQGIMERAERDHEAKLERILAKAGQSG